MKLRNFVCIKIHVLCIIGSIGYYKSNFQGVHIRQRFKKHELRENMYSTKTFTFTVYYYWLLADGIIIPFARCDTIVVISLSIHLSNDMANLS